MTLPAAYLCDPQLDCCAEFLAQVAASRDLHRGWVSPPSTKEAFAAYIKRAADLPTYKSFWVRCAKTDTLAGVFNVSEIVRGAFNSAYLGYYAFVPLAGRGYMATGIRLVLKQIFMRLRLHRIEANLQPTNHASKKLLMRCGFRQEGYSPRYLKIAGRWRDHERWALLAEQWHQLKMPKG